MDCWWIFSTAFDQLHKHSKTFKNIPKTSNNFKNIQKTSKPFQNRQKLQKHSKSFKNIQKTSKTFKKLQKTSKTFKKLQKTFTKLQNNHLGKTSQAKIQKTSSFEPHGWSHESSQSTRNTTLIIQNVFEWNSKKLNDSECAFLGHEYPCDGDPSPQRRSVASNPKYHCKLWSWLMIPYRQSVAGDARPFESCYLQSSNVAMENPLKMKV